MTIAYRLESMSSIEIRDQRVFLRRNISAPHLGRVLKPSMSGYGGEHRILDAAPEHPAAHEQGIYVDDVGRTHQYHHADQAVIPETIRDTPGKDLYPRSVT